MRFAKTHEIAVGEAVFAGFDLDPVFAIRVEHPDEYVGLLQFGTNLANDRKVHAVLDFNCSERFCLSLGAVEVLFMADVSSIRSFRHTEKPMPGMGVVSGHDNGVVAAGTLDPGRNSPVPYVYWFHAKNLQPLAELTNSVDFAIIQTIRVGIKDKMSVTGFRWFVECKNGVASNMGWDSIR